jgi:PhoH-like ATPase
MGSTATQKKGIAAHDTAEHIVAPEPEGTIIVLDTSVLFFDPECFDTLPTRYPGVKLGIPWIVTEEVDNNKYKPDVGWDAREVIRRIEVLQREGGIEIFSRPTSKYYKAKRGNLRADKPDHQIIATAKACEAQAGEKKVILMSRDTLVRVWARELGVDAQDYPFNKVNATFDSELKRINVPENVLFESDEFEFDCSKIGKINPNDGVVCCSKNDRGEWVERCCAIKIGDDRFHRIDDDIKMVGLKPYTMENGNGNGNGEGKNGYSKGIPSNWAQIAAMAQLLNRKIEAVFLQGGAGTGKTLLALAAAIEQRKDYINIVIARPMVHLEDKDEMGFLPGGIEEKMAPWVEPIQQAFSFLSRIDSSNRELIAKLQEVKKIIIKPLDYIRGETYHKSFMVIDEAQNLTPHQVKTIITRAGNRTKMVFTGDLGQIDRNRRLDSKTSGLAYAMDRMAGEDTVGIVNFKDVVRSPLAGMAERLL